MVRTQIECCNGQAPDRVLQWSGPRLSFTMVRPQIEFYNGQAPLSFTIWGLTSKTQFYNGQAQSEA